MKRTCLASMTSAVLALAFQPLAHAAPPADAQALRSQLLQTYPSLLYVERYRKAFPAEAEGGTALWTASPSALSITTPEETVDSLVGLADQHVALAGPRAGKSETLGILFRTASDGAMIVWRSFDPLAGGVTEGDTVIAINGEPVKAWLERTARKTFGGNRRGRYAEAATQLGLGTPVVHQLAGLGKAVELRVASTGGPERNATLAYLPMNGTRAQAMTQAIARDDLPPVIAAPGLRIGSLRIGAFAPQYDPAYLAAEEAASNMAGKSDDDIMLAGFCAVVRKFIDHYDDVAARSDVMVIDLRGNLGGFDRLARRQVEAIANAPMAEAYDLFKGKRQGRVRLAVEKPDPSCAHVHVRRPIVVYDDGATRSGGEFMAAWLWSTGAPVVGETTVGAGGGFEVHSEGFLLPASGMRVRVSGNFTLFAPAGRLHDGDWSEKVLVDIVSQDGFGPSRKRAFAIQSVGLRPDAALSTSVSDLQDGGVARLTEGIAALRASGALRVQSGGG